MPFRYEKIHEGQHLTNVDLEPHCPGKNKKKRITRFMPLIKDVLLILLSTTVIILILKLPTQTQPTRKGCDCGDSTAQARALGCRYDSIGAAWLPAHCIDQELMDEFDTSGDGPDGRWQYWADSNHTQLFTMEEVAALADSPGSLFFTTPRWHFMHCFFYWRKQQRAKFTGVTIEVRYDNERHVKHCGKMFESSGHAAWSYVELHSDNPEEPAFVKDIMVD
ncbi:Pre-mRNA-splicing factor SLU7 [Podospora aff. communis PSN243]|uniref:Pre-mRNA-splicing factor SLU7 n=1 Tax=Podospora aff. communis PSN243 TaxID=3040156 RepID=A0AAV9H5X9_9PEZI|nr:Pre-mRNA-splicing factor SLU7 [Podospora aff. communis PSN243]